MGRLTEDMSRLRTEINALRIKRNEFIGNMQAFVNDLKKDVSQTRNGFHNVRAATAQEAKNYPADFIPNVKVSVFGISQGYENDTACTCPPKAKSKGKIKARKFQKPLKKKVQKKEETIEAQHFCESKSDTDIKVNSPERLPEMEAWVANEEAAQSEHQEGKFEEKALELESVAMAEAEIKAETGAEITPPVVRSKKSRKNPKQNKKQRKNKS